MPRGEKKAGGRPRIPINEEQMKICASKQFTVSEIAAFFGVSRELIYKRYYTIIEEGRQLGLLKLRELQWKRAVEGSDRMIEHMSKHYLGQHEKLNIQNVPDETLIEEAKRRMEKQEEEE